MTPSSPQNSQTIYTIHNMAHLGLFPPEEILTAGLGCGILQQQQSGILE